MPQRVAAVTKASTVGRAWRRPCRRRGSSMSWKNSGRDRVRAALSVVLGHSMSQAAVEMGGPQPGPRAPAQGMKEQQASGVRARCSCARLGRNRGCVLPRSSWRRARRCPGSTPGSTKISARSRSWPKRAGQSFTRRRTHSESTREPRLRSPPGRIRKRTLLVTRCKRPNWMP